MKRRNKNTVGRMYGKKKLVVGLTVIFGILCSIIIIITYYGQNVGSFSIKLDDELKDRKIYISTDPEFSWYNTRLEADTVKDATNTSLFSIDTDECRSINGSYIGNNKGYLSYTFYLKNMGSETVDVQEMFKINKVTNDMDNAVWIWYFEDQDTSGTVYKKTDTTNPENWEGYPAEYPETEDFKGDKVILNRQITNFRPGDTKKFTLVIWLESYDPDCDVALANGLIQYTLSFSVLTNEENDA